MTDLVSQLVGALEKLCGTSDDPRNGWRGTGGTDVLFACEYCGAKHEDCTKIEHTNSCPIPTARAALTAAKAGGWVAERAALVDELIRCAGRRDVLHAQHMGKAMPDDAYAEFTKLRDVRIPELRAQLTAAPQAPALDAVVGVSDEEIEEIARGKSNHVEFARAILAQRPQAVPMTDEVKEQALDLLAMMFDAYENGVPCHEDNGGGYIGMAFSLDNETFHACADILNAHRPKAHHGITQRADGGEVGRG